MRDRAIEIDMHIEIWSLYRESEQRFKGRAMLGEDFMEFGGIIWSEIRLIADIFAVTSSESSYPWIAFREATDVDEV